MEELFTGKIGVFKDGYRWVTDRYGCKLRLNASNQEEAMKRVCTSHDGLRFYDPFTEQPALFRILAAIQPTKEGILRFANRYGSLTRMVAYDELPSWQRLIRKMHDTVELWDSIRERKLTDRQQMTVNRWAAKRKDEPRFSQKGWIDGDPIRKATDMLDWILGRQASWALELRIMRPDGHGLMIRLETTSLPTALWLQFLRAVERDLDYVNCSICGIPYPLAPDMNRADKRYCGEACRMKAYRRRKKNARELSAAGKSIKAIARELDSDEKTVRGWLGEDK